MCTTKFDYNEIGINLLVHWQSQKNTQFRKSKLANLEKIGQFQNILILQYFKCCRVQVAF